MDAKIGSISSKFEHFNDWKRLAEDAPGVVDKEVVNQNDETRKRFKIKGIFDHKGHQ